MTVLISIVWKIMKHNQQKHFPMISTEPFLYHWNIDQLFVLHGAEHTHTDCTKTSRIAVCFPLGPFHTVALPWWGVWVERQVNRGQEWAQRERENEEEAHMSKNRPRINFNHLCSSCCLVSWREGGVNQADRDVAEQRSSHHQRMRRKAWACCSWVFVCLEGCSRAGNYLCRWCRCPRSLACRYTGVLWWCWCRWRSHHTDFGRWRTRHALQREWECTFRKVLCVLKIIGKCMCVLFPSFKLTHTN